MDAVNTLFALIKYTVFRQSVPRDILKDPETLKDMLDLAKKHSATQLASHAILENRLLPAGSPWHNAVYHKLLTVTAKVTRICHEEQDISRVLEQAKIRHVMLKGAVMRTLYPESWMRPSSDIDVLVSEEALDRAVDVLVEELGYQVHGRKNYHDICLISPSGIPLELHFSILENMDGLDAVLQEVWQYVVPAEGREYSYIETPEFFLFHHLAHMAYHFKGGGCGIRFFLDLMIIQEKLGITPECVRPFTDKAGITAFAEAAFHLAAHWFADTPISETEKRMEAYVLDGGCFGSKRARLSIQQDAHGGRKKHLLRRIFPPKEDLAIHYAWVKNRPCLVPIAWLLRWFSLLNPQKRKRIREELETGRSITDAERSEVATLLSDLKLQ